MSEYNVAECPKCGKHDFVLKEDGKWVCLNPKCRFSEKMPASSANAESNPSTFSVLLATFIIALLMFALIG